VTPLGQWFAKHIFYHPYYCSNQKTALLTNLIIVSLNHHNRVDRQNFFVTMTLKQNMTFEQDNSLAFNRDPDLHHEKLSVKNPRKSLFFKGILFVF
jgi:hypothetical protein